MPKVNQPKTVFQVHSVIRKANDVWATHEMRLAGCLTSGSLSLGDTIQVPVLGGGYVVSTIARFTEELTGDGLGLPFYNTVQAEPGTFCICIDGSCFHQDIVKVPCTIEKF